jgi:hypothetical protein
MECGYEHRVQQCSGNTWILVPRLKDKPVISANWTFKTKYGVTGEIEKLKARVVAGGNHQTKGVDYHETYTSVS